jgi:hypothetical protein
MRIVKKRRRKKVETRARQQKGRRRYPCLFPYLSLGVIDADGVGADWDLLDGAIPEVLGEPFHV